MTAVQAVLASMPKVTPTVLSTQQTATETIAGLKKAQTDPEDPSRDAEVADTAETEGGKRTGTDSHREPTDPEGRLVYWTAKVKPPQPEA
jgi:hypothetical protein